MVWLWIAAEAWLCPDGPRASTRNSGREWRNACTDKTGIRAEAQNTL